MARPSSPSAGLGDELPDTRRDENLEQEDGPVTKGVSFCSHLLDFNVTATTNSQEEEPDPLFTADDLALAVDEARRVTAKEVEAELRATIAGEVEQRRCNILNSINDQISSHRSTFEKELDRLSEVSHRLALALSNAVIPRAMEKLPLADIGDVLKSTMARLVEEPTIEVRLSKDLERDGEVVIADLVKEIGITGVVTTIADSTLGSGDLELRWKGGAIDRHLDRLQDEALKLVDCWLQESQPPSGQCVTVTTFTTMQPETPGNAPAELDVANQQMSEPHHEC